MFSLKLTGTQIRLFIKYLGEVREKIHEELISVANQNDVVGEQTITENSTNDTELKPYICLPYFGIQGENLLHKFKGQLKNILPNNVKPRIIYKGKKWVNFSVVKIK